MSNIPGRDVVIGAQWDLLNRVAVDLDAIVTFDPLVPRDPRLLVPVDLQAYVVPTAGEGDPERFHRSLEGARIVASRAADEATRHLGKRVAEVVGWVTHARSHHHH